MALSMNIEQLIIQEDSKVVFVQVTGLFEAKEENMKHYSEIERVSSLVSRKHGSRK